LNIMRTTATADPIRARVRSLRTFPLLALLLAGLLACPATSATVGDVFVSYSADGVPSYASHRRDASYRLFIRGEKAPDARSRVFAAKATTGDQQQGRLQVRSADRALRAPP
jgi:hypothetical protein